MDVRRMLPFILVILTSRLAGCHECGASESVACRQEIEDLRRDGSRYYYASDNRTLAEMCRKQMVAFNCVSSFARECLTGEEQAYFEKLVLGSDKFLDTFCLKDSALRKRYLVHSPCLRNISEKLDDCTRHYQGEQRKLDARIDGDPDVLLERTCCIYFENIRCSSNATREACGPEAAQLVSELWTLLSGTYLTQRCQPYSQYDPESCTLNSASARIAPWTAGPLWALFILYNGRHILTYPSLSPFLYS